MYFLFINRCLVHIMKANSRHNDVAPPSSPWQQEASHPYPKIKCRCKQARCSTCHKCQRCGCTCNKHGVSVGNNRSCRKLLELPRNCDHSIPTKSHHNNSTSRKRRGRPPKNKRVLSDSTANNPLSPKSPTTSPPQKSLMTPTAYTARRQSQTETPSKVFTSNPIQRNSSDIGSRVKSL